MAGRPPLVPRLPEDAFGENSPASKAGKPAATIAGAPKDSHAHYTVAPPPATGQSALRQFSDVATVAVVGAVRDRDAKGKEVVFYELTCVSLANAWSVFKRFSDFYEFHTKCKDSLCLEHNDFVDLPELPSRVNIGTLSDSAVEKRRAGLQRYMEQFLSRMQQVEVDVRAAAVSAHPDEAEAIELEEARLNASIQHFVAFVRANSLSSVVRHDSSPARQRTARVSVPSSRSLIEPIPAPAAPAASYPVDDDVPSRSPRASPRSNDAGDDIPPVRITRFGEHAFVAMLFVPGVQAKDLYVMVNPEVPRHAIVGGRWNGLAASSAAKDTIAKLVANRAPRGDGEAPKVPEPDCYYDSLPVGEFEVTFEVPEPFPPAVYFTHLQDGVFHVTWTTDM